MPLVDVNWIRLISASRPNCDRSVTKGLALKALLVVMLALTVPMIGRTQSAPGGCVLSFTDARDYRPGKYVQESTYRSHGVLLKLIEDAHFTPNVESLRSSNNGAGKPGGDISWTLRVYPNHYRALMAIIALGEKDKTPQPTGSTYPVECWLQRAVTFRPDDNIARMIYAQYLIRAKRNDEAERQLIVVASQADGNAFTHNNIGLLYYDMTNYEKALFHAHIAHELGLRIPTLRDQLKSAGKWTEPAEAPAGESVKNSQ